jgi:hypothetical protein
MIAFTSICLNYLPKARVLARSFKQHHPAGRFVLGLVERDYPRRGDWADPFDQVILARDLPLPNFDQFIFQHDIVEASTSIKGALLQAIYDAYPQEREVIYLDPDIKVYSPFTELLDDLRQAPLVLTPHICEPEEDPFSIVDNELCALRHGVYNLGFLAVARSDEARAFMDWWAARLRLFCYNDIPNGIFTDQRWVDLAPCFFPAKVLRHPGYNFAPWNFSRRALTRDAAGRYAVNGLPLRFCHFSGFDSGGQAMMAQRYVRDPANALYQLRDEYLQELMEMGQAEWGKAPWSYRSYHSGEPILKEARIRYRTDPSLTRLTDDPFRLANALLCQPVRKGLLRSLVSGLVKTVFRPL